MSEIKKVAFFVEGFTEMLFIEKLLTEVLTKNKYTIKKQSIRGGKNIVLSTNILKDFEQHDEINVYILISDCGGDSTVRSYINEHRESLIKADYSTIIGLVDLYPLQRDKYHLYRDRLHYKLPQKPIPITIIVSVMEIEAWFIANHSHFLQISPLLTLDFIDTELKLKLEDLVVEELDKPAKILDSIYQLAGESYTQKNSTKKDAESIKKTINSLDFAEFYFELPNRIYILRELIGLINKFLIN